MSAHGVSGGGCDGSWSFGNCSAVFFDFFLEIVEAPKVLLREEPVFCHLFYFGRKIFITKLQRFVWRGE